MKTRWILLSTLVTALVLALAAGLTHAQGPEPPEGAQPQGGRGALALVGTAFTYQGQLKRDGNPVNDTCDFQFSLWDSLSNSTGQVGSTQTRTGVQVTNGLFTIPDLDFGAGAFQGDARWLQIAVQCTGDTGYTTLSPRQPLTAVPYALALPGLWTQPNANNLIGGYRYNSVDASTVGATIGGGGSNTSPNTITADANYGTISGGLANTVGGFAATVGGGRLNNAADQDTAIGGGAANNASGQAATIAGGNQNTASGYATTVSGGGNNEALSDGAAVGGGMNNSATGGNSVIGGGAYNTISSTLAAIGGGWSNLITGTAYYAAIAGGYNITVTSQYAAVGGGRNNTASGDGATVGGGDGNTASGTGAAVGGGGNNKASGWNATVGGGGGNTASGTNAAVGGGYGNVASGGDATIAGGHENTASGSNATVPGGYRALADHYGQMAYASGRFSSNGDAQTSLYVMRNTSTGSSWTTLYLDGISTPLAVAAGRTMTFDILVVGRSDAGESAGYRVEGVIENVGGTVAFVGTPTVTTLGEDDLAWDVQVSLDTFWGALLVQVRGNGETIRWVATVRTVEVAW